MTSTLLRIRPDGTGIGITVRLGYCQRSLVWVYATPYRLRYSGESFSLGRERE